MHINKGFSLIELMIVVAIISILSLFAIPIYQDYITRVKLTEALILHKHNIDMAELEFISGGQDGLFSFLKSSCISNYSEKSIYQFDCTTNFGVLPQSKMTVYKSWGGVMIIIRSPNYSSIYPPINNTAGENSYQTIFIHDANNDVRKSSLTYILPNHTYIETIPGIPGIIPDRKEEKTNLYTFDFRKNHRENLIGGVNLRIEDKNGNISVAPLNRWFCASELENGRRGETPYDRITFMPRSIRPLVCSYTNRQSDDTSVFGRTYVEF